MASNTSQRTTINGRPIISSKTGLPEFSSPVEYRIKRVKAELNRGLSKFDSAWNNITRDISNIVV